MHLPEPHHEATPARLRAKFIFHVVIGVLLIPTIICGIIRISGGAGSNVIGMSLKSYVLLAYVVLTERNDRLQRWASKKAYAILNCMEIVFWAVPFGLSAKGAAQGGSAASLAAAIVLVFLCLALMGIFTYLCYVYVQDYRLHKRSRQVPIGKPVEQV